MKLATFSRAIFAVGSGIPVQAVCGSRSSNNFVSGWHAIGFGHSKVSMSIVFKIPHIYKIVSGSEESHDLPYSLLLDICCISPTSPTLT